MKKLKIIVLTFLVGFSQLLNAASSPVPMLEETANKIIATLKENKSSIRQNKDIIKDAVAKYLLPKVDVQGMARSVLGRQEWNKASHADKKAFTEQFTQLVVRTYATPLAEYTDETVKFLPQRTASNGRFTRVNSVIMRSNGQNIPLTYSLVAKNGDWKIYDLSVEGVSLLQSFRSQFNQALQNESLAELIAQMKQNNKVS